VLSVWPNRVATPLEEALKDIMARNAIMHNDKHGRPHVFVASPQCEELVQALRRGLTQQSPPIILA
jgi:hypothetical protein